ncbi:MAG: YceD family protein [Legionellales bacterium]
MLYLQELVKQEQQTQKITIIERLPLFLSTPCLLDVTYRVVLQDDYYLIHLGVTGTLHVVCQRCMNEFIHSYENHTVIAVCRSDERAERLLEHYECIVSSSWQVDLEALIIDELHLYAPQFHPNLDDCGDEINRILQT